MHQKKSILSNTKQYLIYSKACTMFARCLMRTNIFIIAIVMKEEANASYVSLQNTLVITKWKTI